MSEEHEAELSLACKTHQEQVRASADAFKAAYGDDIKKHCALLKPGRGAVLKCLHEKEKDFSADCTKVMEQRDAAKHKVHGSGSMTK